MFYLVGLWPCLHQRVRYVICWFGFVYLVSISQHCVRCISQRSKNSLYFLHVFPGSIQMAPAQSKRTISWKFWVWMKVVYLARLRHPVTSPWATRVLWKTRVNLKRWIYSPDLKCRNCFVQNLSIILVLQSNVLPAIQVHSHEVHVLLQVSHIKICLCLTQTHDSKAYIHAGSVPQAGLPLLFGSSPSGPSTPPCLLSPPCSRVGEDSGW